jgi:hypothetical protein
MTEPGLRQYPNSDPNGAPLPFDVGDLHGSGFIEIDGTDSDAFTIANTPGYVLILVLIATTCDVVFTLDNTATVITAGTFTADQGIVLKNQAVKVLATEAISIKARSLDGTSTGQLTIYAFRAWKSGGIGALTNSL